MSGGYLVRSNLGSTGRPLTLLSNVTCKILMDYRCQEDKTRQIIKDIKKNSMRPGESNWISNVFFPICMNWVSISLCETH